MKLSVREIEKRDVELICNYWLNSDDDFLISLGVELAKLPSRDRLSEMLSAQIDLPYEEKGSYAIIWELDGSACGHCNVNDIVFGKNAFMHIHLWESEKRKKGMGLELIKQSIPFFFKNLELKEIICEPYALNNAPSKVLEKIGFEFIKEHVCVPGSLSFEQSVKRWRISKDEFQKISELPIS